jgi:hypothetical protein
VEVPTGGKGAVSPSPRAPGIVCTHRGQRGRGQQIRCNSEADGHSPDERERFQCQAVARRKDVVESISACRRVLPAIALSSYAEVPHALILVMTNEDNHESDVPPQTQQ